MKAVHSKANIEKKRKKRKHLFVIIPAALLVCFGLFLYYAFAQKFHVQEKIITNTSFVNKEEMKVLADEVLSQKLWGFIPKRSPYLIDTETMEKTFYETYPSIRSVEVEVQNRTLYIDVTERKATAVACTYGNTCFFLDDQGYAFAAAPRFEGSSFIKIVTYDDDIAAGKTVIAKEEFDEMIKMLAVFKAHSLPVQSVTLVSREDMSFIGPRETSFLVRRKDIATKIEERMKALLVTKSDIAAGMYEYIDLRIDSKIFLKNKES